MLRQPIEVMTFLPLISKASRVSFFEINTLVNVEVEVAKSFTLLLSLMSSTFRGMFQCTMKP